MSLIPHSSFLIPQTHLIGSYGEPPVHLSACPPVHLSTSTASVSATSSHRSLTRESSRSHLCSTRLPVFSSRTSPPPPPTSPGERRASAPPIVRPCVCRVMCVVCCVLCAVCCVLIQLLLPHRPPLRYQRRRHSLQVHRRENGT